MSDKYISQSAISLLINKLGILLESVNNEYSSGKMVTEGDILSLYQLGITNFIKNYNSSLLNSVGDFLSGTQADPIQYNIFNDIINKELQCLFLQLGSLDKLISSSFNSIIANKNKVLNTSKRISNKIGDYLLYADPSLGAGYFFGDSFNTLDKIESSSSLLEKDECFINIDEGVVLLPLDGSPQKIDIKSIVVNKNSNGSFGNISDQFSSSRDDIIAVTDGEPNTWVEYERISNSEAKEPLILDITISLKELSIINYIHINPFNFGTATPIKIKTIETSSDGKIFRSIKEDVPIKDFIPSVQDDPFELSSSVNKNAGQGFYSFLPRKTQFIHLVFEQYTPYPLENNNLRYAIGIRDINIYRRKYKSEGSIISIPFSSNNEIKKVSLWASETPIIKSSLGGVSHYISNDDSGTWYELTNKENNTGNIPEIINFNNSDNDSINTSAPVYSLRHKIYLNRLSDGFNDEAIISQKKINNTELLQFSTNSNILTKYKFIEESLDMLLPFYGSYSCPRERYGSNVLDKSFIFDLNTIEFTVENSGVDTLRFNLPFQNISNLENKIRVFVNNEQIQYSNKDKDYLDNPTNTTYSTIDENSKIYYLNKSGKELQFGYTTESGGSFSRRGFLPPAGSKISVLLDGDNPSLELTDNGYVLTLSSYSDAIKENVKLVAFKNLSNSEFVDHSIELKKDKVIKLKVSNARNYEITPYKTVIYEPKIQEKSFYTEQSSNEYNLTGDYLPPIYSSDISTYSIKEYDYDGNLLVPSRTWTAKQFIDGDRELRDYNGSWIINTGYYSFDITTGTIHLGGVPESDRRTVFQCKKLIVKYIENNKWDFVRNSITGKLESNKILLSPEVAFPLTRKIAISSGDRKIQLTEDNDLGHSWFNQRIVKGTVKLNKQLFSSGIVPIEVPYIDGEQELKNIINVLDEEMVLTETSTSNLYEYQLYRAPGSNIIMDHPGFSVKRSINSLSVPVNIFQTYVSSTPSSNGEWTYTNGIVYVYWDSTITDTFIVNYMVQNNNSGIDSSSLYSVDYENGILYLGSNNTDGDVTFQISIYSAFYNISKSLTDNEIQKDSENKTITFKEKFNIDLLKLSPALKAMPQFAKITYQYYDTKSESIKDLEPYFSPICKDIAFRAVTKNIIEDI